MAIRADVIDLDPCGRQHRRGVSAGRFEVAVDEGAYANPFDQSGSTPTQRLGALVEYAVWLAGRRDEVLAVRQRLHGRDLLCTCDRDDLACHRNVLLDIANPPETTAVEGGRAMALTLRRPWASLLLVPAACGGKTVENRTWATDYRGPVLVYAGTRIDPAGVGAAQRAGLDARWHEAQRGWLGAAVLTDVHRARATCCRPWGQPQRRPDTRIYHWVFDHPARLAAPTWGLGFPGLRPTSWSVLIRRSMLKPAASKTDTLPLPFEAMQ